MIASLLSSSCKMSMQPQIRFGPHALTAVSSPDIVLNPPRSLCENAISSAPESNQTQRSWYMQDDYFLNDVFLLDSCNQASKAIGNENLSQDL